MAILYVFSVTDPNNVGAFPPSVSASSWFENILEYMVNHLPNESEIFSMTLTPITGKFGAYFFNDEDEFNSFMAEYTLTDASLLADIEAWKVAHSITYDHKIYSITDTGASTPKFI
jgi:hypothetical protein